MNGENHYSIVILGSGPAGQKAAIKCAKSGRRVAIVESERSPGGWCVHRGTIPSKTLREAAIQISRMEASASVFEFKLKAGIEIRALIHRMDEVITAHERVVADQLTRNEVETIHGRARFASPHEIVVHKVGGATVTIHADKVIIATGSRPRTPPGVPIDHENILDSDSILSLTYLPQSLAIWGSGVIGSEYASIFSLLGVEVTLIDKTPRPLAFMPEDLTERFLRSFERRGGVFLPGRHVRELRWDGATHVVTTLECGAVIESEKLLVCQGRIANVDRIAIENAGLKTNEYGILPVDEYCRTSIPHIYAAGDVIGPPGLASSAMEQGRRAAAHAMGEDPGLFAEILPVGIYTIPEMSVVGLNEEKATEKYGNVIVGQALLDEVTRGQISDVRDGLLKLIADPEGRRLLGVEIVGEGATELIHIGQMVLLTTCDVDLFVEKIFNFPTLAEAYRVAALHIVNQREELDRSGTDPSNEAPPVAV